MPTETHVDHIYQALLKEGKSEASAAKIAQYITGDSLETGKKSKAKKDEKK